MSSEMSEISKEKLVKYFKANLSMLPSVYTGTETNRMTLAFFCLGALSLLGELDNQVTAENKKDWIDWIYAQQLLPTGEKPDANEPYCGFRGSSWSGRKFEPFATRCDFQHYDSGHIANTYTALLNLLLLGDDLSRVNRQAIIKTIKKLQKNDGSVAPTYGSLERDVRFIFCACSVSYILNDWSGIDIDKTTEHIRRLQSYEYAVAQCPDQEAHGGSTYCGVAALALMNRLHDGLLDKDRLIEWCLQRQVNGFQGRPNKLPDVCYGFWIGASLDILNSFPLVNDKQLKAFLLECQHKMGGFGKDPESFPDLLHAYMGVATLALLKEPGIDSIYSPLNAPSAAYRQMKEKSIFWNKDEH